MTADDLRALPVWAGDRTVTITEAQRDALADLIDAADRVHAWCMEKDDGQPWNLIMQMGETLAALDGDQ